MGLELIDDGGGDGRLSYGILPEVLGYHLRQAQIAVFKRFAEEVTAVEDITPGLFGMLQMIAANPGLGQSRLAEAMGVDRSAIVKVIDRLQRRGLIVRVGSERDRRCNRLELTEAGKAAIQRLEAEVRAHEERFTTMLTAEERQTLIRLLTRLHAQGNAEGRDE